MSNKKLFVSDLDGTLLKIGDQVSAGVSDKNKEAIKKFIDAGNIFAIASGRGRDYQSTINKITGQEIDFIGCNGAQIALHDHEVISSFIPTNIIEELFIYIKLQHFDMTFCISTDDELYYSSKINYPFTPSSKRSSAFLLKDCVYFEDLSTINDDIIKCMCFVDANILVNVKNDLIRAFGDQLEIVHSDTDLIDIMMKDCSKASGVELLAKHYNINPNNIGTIGDSDNDISMLKAAKHAYAMSHSEPEVKLSANKIVESVSEALQDFMK